MLYSVSRHVLTWGNDLIEMIYDNECLFGPAVYLKRMWIFDSAGELQVRDNFSEHVMANLIVG